MAVEFIDLTLSDAEGAIEEELNNKNGKFNIYFSIFDISLNSILIFEFLIIYTLN